MSYSDQVSNKHNAPSDHYVASQIGPKISFFHRENLEKAIDECEDLLETHKDLKSKLDVVKTIKGTLEDNKPEEWVSGVEFLWGETEKLIVGFNKLGFRVLRNYPLLSQMQALMERHISGVNEHQE